ncbi:unnamed protein product [Darwinula stevensoni]|uniref:C2 domain-containing protein n=1 Tax=Darwinula stevensoni TaxID=69355 RepID=A0A7R9AEC3_9CRUS|nr:unnamed protein product [Darwinula stevensoni]CAG0902244.1 unnamed protein product [Darwinula stevensoni]
MHLIENNGAPTETEKEIVVSPVRIARADKLAASTASPSLSPVCATGDEKFRWRTQGVGMRRNSESEARKDEAWLTVTVFYQRPTETLHVRVLRVHHASPSQDCFVKLRLLPDRTTRSTSVKKDDAEPLFDEEFVFPLTKEGSSLGQGHTLELSLWSLGPSHKTESVGSAQIPLDSMALDMGRAFTMKRFLTHSTKTKLEIHVMTEGKLGSSESIGKVVIGADVPEPERSHFVEMLSSSTGVVPRWHCLAPAE